MTTGAWERLDTGKERKRHSLEKVVEGSEVLTTKPIKLQRLNAGEETEGTGAGGSGDRGPDTARTGGVGDRMRHVCPTCSYG